MKRILLDLVRRFRPILLGIPILMALALVITTLASFLQVRNTAELIARGEGHDLMGAVRSHFPPGTEWSDDWAGSFLEEQREAGLRCLLAFDEDYRTLVRVGSCQIVEDDLPTLVATWIPRRSQRIGDVARLISRRPNPDLLADPDFVPPPRILIEYEPLRARQLERASYRTLAIGIFTSLGLIVLAGLLLSVAKRADRESHLASLGEVAAVISHEIRNPLTSMKGHAQLLEELLPEASRERDKARRVVAEAIRLENLTRDLLRFTRSQQVSPSEAEPASLLRSAAEVVDYPGLELDLSQAPASWPLDGDRFEQTLLNLLQNAAQSAGEGGRVVARIAPEKGRLLVEVRDTGGGIEKGREEEIFEPFRTTRTQGTGLGLAIAKRIVEAHGGWIRASNHSEGGALFRVSIPR